MQRRIPSLAGTADPGTRRPRESSPIRAERGPKLSLRGRLLKDRFNQILIGLIEEKQASPSLKRVKESQTLEPA